MDEQAIFLQAIEYEDSDEQAAFLDRACGTDTHLRCHLEELLAASHRTGGFLETPVALNAAASDRSDPLERCGTNIGPYLLLELIAEGGMGAVYRADQQAPLKRQVALKIIKPGMDTKQVIARFEAERQALALMDHPYIAQVLDAGSTPNGRPYFVMEFVQGAPITDYCNQHRLPLKERLELFVQVCRAIQHAHTKGIIHRDIKPTNVLVAVKDGQAVPKVIDFGIAKATQQRLTEKTLFTSSHQLIGTPEYMSPEQAEMSSLDVDTRSDIYSLGVLLYELLTGSTPFDRKQLADAAFDEVRRIIRHDEPPKPSTRLSQSGERLRGLAEQRMTEPAKLSRSLCGELDWIVMKALEKDRNRRYETANGFAADVQRYLNDEPVVACPPSTGYRLRKFTRQNKTLIATTAIVMVALLLGTIVSAWQANRARKSVADMKASREELRERIYASTMNQASLSLAGDDVYRMRELLNQQIPNSSDEDLRGFEWYLLWRAGHLSQQWARNTSLVHFQDLAVSPDGQMLAAVDRVRSTIHVYDREHLNLICSPLQIRGPFDELRFSPDGRFLIAADTGATAIRIFDTTNWGHVITLDSASNCAVAVARDKPLMATAGVGEIMLWDTTTWKQIDSLPVRPDASHVHHLAFHPDGTKLACALWPKTRDASGHGPIELWDLTERRVVHNLDQRTLRDGQDDLIVFSPDGNRLAIGGMDGVVAIWSVDQLFAEGSTAAPEPIRTYRAANPIGSLAFSPDSTKLALVTSKDESSISTPDALQVWDLATLDSQPMPIYHDHSKQITDVSFVGDSSTICSIACDGTLKLWDLAASRLYDVVSGVEARSAFGYANSGALIYQDDKGFIQSWNVPARKRRAILDTEQTYSRSAISADGSTLAGITLDEKQLRIWNLASESEVYTSSLDLEDLRGCVESHGGSPSDRIISRLTVSNDGRHVTCTLPLRGYGPLPGVVVLIDSKHGRVISDACVLMETWAVPAFSPSGQHLATQEYFSWISMLSEITPTSLTPRLRLKGRDVHLCTAFSPDGKTLAIGNHRNEIHLYDVADGKSIQILKGHTQWLTSVVFSRDGNHLVSSALDGTVRIWKQWRNEFHLVSTLRGHAKNLDIVQVAVAPGGDSLAAVNVDDNSRFGGISPTSTSQQGIIQVWRTVPREEVDRNVDDQFTSAGDVLSTDSDQTLHELGDVLARAPDDLRAREFRARTHQRRGDWKSAVDDWTIALKHAPNPNNFYFLESRAKTYMLGQQWTEALEDWRELVRLTSESNGNYLLGRGECYLHMGRRQDAHADFLAALAQTADVNTLERAIAFLGFAETVFPTETQWRYLTGTQAPLKWEAIDFSGDEILCGRRALCAKRRGRYRVEAYRGSGTCS